MGPVCSHRACTEIYSSHSTLAQRYYKSSVCMGDTVEPGGNQSSVRQRRYLSGRYEPQNGLEQRGNKKNKKKSHKSTWLIKLYKKS